MNGQKLKELRLEQRLTLRQLAEKAGVTHTKIFRYENGANEMKAKDLSAVMKALGYGDETLSPSTKHRVKLLIQEIETIIESED